MTTMRLVRDDLTHRWSYYAGDRIMPVSGVRSFVDRDSAVSAGVSVGYRVLDSNRVAVPTLKPNCAAISEQNRHGIKRRAYTKPQPLPKRQADRDSIASKIGVAGTLKTSPCNLKLQERDRCTGQMLTVTVEPIASRAETDERICEARQSLTLVWGIVPVDVVSRNTRAAKNKLELSATRACQRGIKRAIAPIEREQEQAKSTRYLNCKNRGGRGRRKKQVWRSPNAQAALGA